MELLSGPSLPSEPSADRARIASHPSSPILELWPRRLTSGRYGLISASIIESDSPQSSSSISVSSDEASSQSDQESDLDDEHACIPTVFWDTQGKPSVKIPAFRSFIREICHSAISHSSDVPDEPLEDAPGSPLSDIVIHPSPLVVAEPFPVPRSPSPIDLITPPPSSEAKQSEPAVIGAWPASRPESPRHSSLEVEAGQSEVPLVLERDREPEPVPAPPSPCHTRFSTKSISELVQCLNSPPYFSTSGPFSNCITSDFGLPSIPPPPPPPLPLLPPHYMPPFHPLQRVVTEHVKSEFKGSFKNVEACVVHRPASLSLMGII